MTNHHDLMKQLEFYSKKAADAVRPCFENTDLEGYKKFLDMMYHYTLTSGDKLLTVANNSPNQELHDYFNHMYLEEKNHYMLAQQDLKGFGLSPSKETPKEVEDMNRFWKSLNGKHINSYLGAIYVFENIADKVGKEVMGMLERLAIEKNQKRWLLIHVEADVDHGREIKEVLEKYISHNPQAALDAAEEACKRWSAVSVAPFL